MRQSERNRNRLLRCRAPETAAEWQAYYHLRWLILRAPWQQELGSERDQDEATAIHVAAFVSASEMVGVARLQRDTVNTGRIRYMAVLPEWRGQGVGRALLAYLEDQALCLHLSRLWLNARESVLGFYQQQGYVDKGEAPTLFGQLPHRRMEKTLTS